MRTAWCPLCGARVKYRLSKFYPQTYDSPAEGGDIEDIEPSCGCADLPCVDELKYYEMIEDAIRAELAA